MKRILVIILGLLSMTSVIIADEKVDSLEYYLDQAYADYLDNNFNEACNCYRHALRLYRQKFGDISQDTIYASNEGVYANLCYQIGDYETAIESGIEVLQIYKTYGTNNLQYAKCLNNLAVFYASVGNYDDAIVLISEALDIRKKLLGSNHPDYALSLNNLATYHAHLGHFREAIQLTLESMEITKDVLGTEHPDYVRSLGNLAVFYSELGNYNEAIRLEKEATEITKKYLGANHPVYAVSLDNLAACYSSIGNYNEAIKLGTEAMEIYKRVLGTEHPDYAGSLANLASYYSSLGDYNEAIRLGTEALEIRKRVLGVDHPDYALSLGNLASYYDILGNYNEAINLETQSLEIRKKIFGTNHPAYALSLGNLASYYANLGNYDEAIRLSAKSLGIKKIVYGENHPDYATTLNNLATYYDELDNYDEAIRLEKQALEIRKYVFGAEHPDYAGSLGNLAGMYSDLGNYDEAIKLGTEALEIRKNALGTEHPDYALSLGNLATYYAHLGHFNEAIRLETETMEITKRIFGKEHPSYALSLDNLAGYYSDLGNYSEAIPLLYEYVSIIRKNVLRTFSGLTSNERPLYWNKFSYALNQRIPGVIIHSGMSNAAAMLYDHTALFAKGLLLSTVLEMAKLIQESGDEEAIRMYSELRKNRQILTAQYSKAIAERQFDCDSLENATSALGRQLMARVKEFGDYSRNLSITWKDVQNKLGNNDIAIEFLSYCDEDGKTAYAALTLCKSDKDPVLTPLFGEQELLDASGEDGTYHSFRADSLIWAPLTSRLDGKSRVYFSASGMLHNIGIEYLPSMEGKHSYRLSSTRELVTKDKDIEMTTATIYGGIDYDASSKELMEANHGFAIPPSHGANSNMTVHRSLEGSSLRAGCGRLEGSRRESEFISKSLKEKGIITFEYHDSSGTEESFKALSGHSTSLLHIGTHGFYWTPDEAEQQKQMLNNLRFLGENDRRAQAEDKALLRSGLMMAGCNRVFNNETLPDSLDDGVLTAKEISQLDLRGLNLVVLSACETALGDISSSEGVFGLQRAFKKAGAQSIMMSLWKVDDLVTENMMKLFYTHLVQGEPVRLSFTAAQQELRAIDPDPRHWAAFILMDALD